MGIVAENKSHDANSINVTATTAILPEANLTDTDASINRDNLQTIWHKVLVDVQNKPSLGWVRALHLDGIEGNVAKLKIRSGQRQMLGFLRERQRQQVTEILRSIVGRPSLKAEFEISNQALLSNDGNAIPSECDQSQEKTRISGSQKSDEHFGHSTRTQAMQLTLVRELMEVFDLSLVGIREAQRDDAKRGSNLDEVVSSEESIQSRSVIPPYKSEISLDADSLVVQQFDEEESGSEDDHHDELSSSSDSDAVSGQSQKDSNEKDNETNKEDNGLFDS